MNPHERFTSDHQALRQQAAALRETLNKKAPTLSDFLSGFQKEVQKHFKREESYYRILDTDKRVPDRGLIHQLRNDHAAIIFTLESLVIRLRKNGADADWQRRFDTLMNVLLPHLDQEDSHLFPLGKSLLTPAEIESVREHIQNCD